MIRELFRKMLQRSVRDSKPDRNRRLRLEQFEDRRLLAVMADLLFIGDESGHGAGASTKDWLTQMVTGDTNGDGTKDRPSLADELASLGIDDIRYGLVGFGQHIVQENPRYAHSHLFPDGGAGSLFGDPTQLSTTQLNGVFNGMAQNGGREDGWDAIEHVIAEYDFRPGAAPIVIMIQNDEGRVPLNPTQTRDGILAALNAKNVTLNVMVVGDGVLNEDDTAQYSWEPLFDLAPYGLSSDIRVLGVDADARDGLADGSHHFYWVDTDTTNTTSDTPTATTSDVLQISFNGSNTGATGMVGSGKSILIGKNLTGGTGGTVALALAA